MADELPSRVRPLDQEIRRLELEILLAYAQRGLEREKRLRLQVEARAPSPSVDSAAPLAAARAPRESLNGLEAAFLGIGCVPDRACFTVQVEDVAFRHGFHLVQVCSFCAPARLTQSKNYLRSNNKRIVFECDSAKCQFVLYATAVATGWRFKEDRCNFRHTLCESRPKASARSLASNPNFVAESKLNKTRTLKSTAAAMSQMHGIPQPSASIVYRATNHIKAITAAERTIKYSSLLQYAAAFVAQNPSAVMGLQATQGDAKRLFLCYALEGKVLLDSYSFPSDHSGAVVEDHASPLHGLELVDVDTTEVGPVASAANAPPPDQVLRDLGISGLDELEEVEVFLDDELDAGLASALAEPSFFDREDGQQDGDAVAPSAPLEVISPFVEATASGEELAKDMERFAQPSEDALAIVGFYVGLGNAVDVFERIGANVLSVDGGHLTLIKNGKLLVVSSTDSLGYSLPIGFGVCASEDQSNYLRLFHVLGRAGFKPSATNVLASDQGTAVLAALRTAFPSNRNLLCSVHLARAASRAAKTKLSPQQMQLIFRAQARPTEVEFATALRGLQAALPPKVYEYFAALDPNLWARYTFLDAGISLSGLKSSNQAEVVMAWTKQLGLRRLDDLVHGVLTWMSQKFALRAIEAAKHDAANIVTPRALKLYDESCKHASYFTVAAVKDQEIASVSFLDTQKYGEHGYTVDLTTRECPCNGWFDVGVPCSHAVAAADKFGIPQRDVLAWRRSSFAGRHHIEAIVDAYRTPLVPIVHRLTTVPDLVIVPFTLASADRKRGRPVTNRLKGPEERSGRAPGGLSDDELEPEGAVGFPAASAAPAKARRPRKPDTCSKCGAAGHRKSSPKCPQREEKPAASAAEGGSEANGNDENVGTN